MWEQIQSNRRRSAALVVSMAVILFALGFVIAETYVPGAGFYGLAAAAGLWTILTLLAFAGGDSILLGVGGARQIEQKDHPELFNVVEEMTIASGLGKMPRVFIIPDEALNAFAVGRNKDKAAVAITAGLLGRLNRDELQGVIGHEVAHIVNRDVTLMAFASVMLGTIVMMSEVFLRSLWHGGRGARYRSSRGRGKGGGGRQGQAVIAIVAIALAILAPIIARLIYLGISRKREYLADASAAVYTRYPAGLASALEKLGGSSVPVQRASKSTAAMYIVNPFAKVKLSALTSTHPPTADRIRVLRGFGGEASYTEYQRAWESAMGKKAGHLPQSALADPSPAEPIRTAADALRSQDPREQARAVGDLMRTLDGFLILPCVCGLKLKLPPDYPRNYVACPRCKREIDVLGRE